MKNKIKRMQTGGVVPLAAGIAKAEAQTVQTPQTAPIRSQSSQTAPKVTLSKDQLRGLSDLHGRGKEGLPGIAQQIVGFLSTAPYYQDNFQGLDYNSLRDGTHPLISGNTGLTDSQIIETFAADSEGRPIRAGDQFFRDFVMGAAYEATPSMAMLKGAQYGWQAMPAVRIGRRGSPASAVATFIPKAIGGLLGGFASRATAQELQDRVVGEEPTFVPGTAGAFEAGQSMLGAAAMLSQVYRFNSTVDLFTPRINTFIQNYVRRIKGESGRVPQAVALSGEAGAILGTGAGTLLAEERFSGNPYARLFAEIGGGVIGGIGTEVGAGIVAGSIKRAGQGISVAADLLKRVREGGVDAPSDSLAGLSNQQLADAREFLIRQFELNEEDVSTVINALKSDELGRFIQRYNPEAGPIRLNAAQITGSPTLYAATLQTGAEDGGSKVVADAQEALRKAVMLAYATGDRTALGDFATIQTASYEQEIENTLGAGLSRLQTAMTNVRGADEPILDAEKLIEAVTQASSVFRQHEAAKWKAVPQNIQITEFVDDAGNLGTTSNLVRFFDQEIAPVEFKEAREIDLSFPGMNLLESYVKRLSGQSTDIYATPGLGDVLVEGGTPSVGINATEHFRMYSQMLNKARQARQQGDANAARLFSGAAQAILKDLDSLPLGVSAAYDDARAYSRAYNDVFRRMFPAEILGTTKEGAARLTPDELAFRYFNGDLAFLRARQLDQIAQVQFGETLTTLLDASDRPAGKALLDSAEAAGIVNPDTRMIDRVKFDAWFDENADALRSIGAFEDIQTFRNLNVGIRGSVEGILRSLRAKSLNPDGTLNTTTLSNELNKPSNAYIQEAFPALYADLQNVLTARTLLTESEGVAKEIRDNAMRGVLSVYELLPNKAENPASQMARALSTRNKTPFRDLNNLWRYIDEMPEEGFTVVDGPNAGTTFSREDLVEGFKTSIYDALFDRAGVNGPNFNAANVSRTLFEPHPNSTTDLTLADWLVQKGVMPETEVGSLRQLLRKAVEIEAFQAANPGDMEAFAKEMGPIFALLGRISGANLGTNISQAMGGSNTLIAASAGSKYSTEAMTKFLSEFPAATRQNTLRILLLPENAQLLGELLQTGVSPARKEGIVNNLLSALRSGLEAGKTFAGRQVISTGRRVAPAIQNLAEEEGPQVGGFGGERQKQERAIEQVLGPTSSLSVPPAQLPTQGGGAVPSPVPVGPAVSQRPAIQSSGPVDRARFAALFPEDRELIQGIGSLRTG